jgi:hypothetical protein
VISKLVLTPVFSVHFGGVDDLVDKTRFYQLLQEIRIQWTSTIANIKGVHFHTDLDLAFNVILVGDVDSELHLHLGRGLPRLDV